jgi:glycosyltransferase involved in cell wall biosynthesis
MPRVLYLCFFFPPSRGSGVFRGRATANHLAHAGWDVTVITAPRSFFSHNLDGAVDESLEATVDDRVRVERTKMNAYRWERDVRRFSWLRGNFPLLANKMYQAWLKLVFPEPYLGWAPGVLRRAVRLHLRRRFDVIVATGNPFVSFAIARALGKVLNIPYVMDYRDAWTFDQFTGKLVFPEGSKAMKWERRVLRDAAGVVVVNDGMREWYDARYPFIGDRMLVVRNGWDPDTLADVPFRAPNPDAPLRFAYMGTVTRHMPLDVLFEGWRRARVHPLLAGAELHMYGHLGFFPYTVAQIKNRLDRESSFGVRYSGAFTKVDASETYGRQDVLVFCAGGSKYVTSGKVFEYMASGKPIVSVHQPGFGAEEVLRGYPLWFSGSKLDPDTVAQSMIAAAKAARDVDAATHRAAVEHAATFVRENAMVPWEARLRGLVDARRR